MIFVTVGTQKFQFNRLLAWVDELVAEGKIKDEVFAQIGNSTYQPKNYKYTQFISPQEFGLKVSECSVYITHGGVGSLVAGLNVSKPVIAVARLAEYGEHIDDHQLQITGKYNSLGYIMLADSKENLLDCINKATTFKSSYKKTEFAANAICDYIDKYIQNGGKK